MCLFFVDLGFCTQKGFGNVGNLWSCWMNLGLNFRGIGIVKNLCYRLGWISSWCMWDILWVCVNFISWIMAKFCRYVWINLWVRKRSNIKCYASTFRYIDDSMPIPFLLNFFSVLVKTEISGIMDYQNNGGHNEDLELPFFDLHNSLCHWELCNQQEDWWRWFWICLHGKFVMHKGN